MGGEEFRALEETAELEQRSFGSAMEVLRARGEMDVILKRQSELQVEIRSFWPVSGAELEELAVERMLTFLEWRPRYIHSFLHERAYWPLLASRPLDAATVRRLEKMIIDLLAEGFSTSLELAAPVAARIWSEPIADAVAASTMSTVDPQIRAAASRFGVRVRRRRDGVGPDPLPPTPGTVHPAMVRAAERLRDAVDRHVTPDLRAAWSFNPPASDAEIEALKELIAPFPLPASLETWLRVANGIRDAQWWPGFQMGVGYSTDHIDNNWEISHAYPDVGPGLAAVGYGSHIWTALELVGHREAAVVEVGGGARVIAPSLPAFFEAAADCVEAGWFERWRDATGWGDDPLRREFAAIWDARCAREGWDSAPSSPHTWMDEADLPGEWIVPVTGGDEPGVLRA